MKNIEISRVTEIIDLHGKFEDAFKKTLSFGMRIGELLQDQKSELKHGEFGQWIKQNLPFSQRTAQNYMRLHRRRDELKSETVSHLIDAYRLLEEPTIEPLTRIEKTWHCYACCVNEYREDFGAWDVAFLAVERESGMPLNYLLMWHQYFFDVVDDELLPRPGTKGDRVKLEYALHKIVTERCG